MKQTVKISEGKNGFLIGQIKAVLTHGKTIEEVRENIMDALELYLQDMREEKANEKENVILEEELIY